MKISLITVVYNGESFLEECIKSMVDQCDVDLEYIIIDGGSTDGTLRIIEKYKQYVNHFISEKDSGLYDAINKGINLASGDIIGILNADDTLASPFILKEVSNTFINERDLDGLYGDLNYVHPLSNKIIRKWKSRNTDIDDIQKGWMPAHPTLYLKKDVFERYGNYRQDLGTAADYDFILRLFYRYEIKTTYMPVLMVNMKTGGVSNKSLLSRLSALKNDYKALKINKIPNPFLVLLMKKISKVVQFL